MIVTFYNKDFVALQNNASLNVEDWNLKRRAVDFDDFTCTSQPFIEDINPSFVEMKDDLGRYKYGAFAGIPQLNSDNKTYVQASDLKTIHKNFVVLNFGEYEYLQDMFSYMLNEFYNQVVQDSYAIEYDLLDLATIQMSELKPDLGYTTYNLWEDLLTKYMKFYDLYMESKLDTANKKIVFKISRTNKQKKPLRLYEFGIRDYGKWIADVNECQTCVCVNKSKLHYGDKYILCSDNTITNDLTKRDIYPIKNNIVFKETENLEEINKLLIEGMEECLTTLVDARFNESVEIEVTDTVYEKDWFDVSYDVYTARGKFYKRLPIGEVQENTGDIKKLVIGYKPNDVVFYLKKE